MTYIKGIPKRQHFLPTGIQKQFATGKSKNQIFYMDKTLDRKAIPTNTTDAGHIKYFYNYPDGMKSLEIDFFGEIDNDTPPIIERIVANDSSTVTNQEKNKLIKYVASQISRVPNKKEGLNELNNTLKKYLNINITEDVTTDYLDSIIKNTERHSSFLENKEIIIHRATNKHSFIISDNPVSTIRINDAYTVIGDIIPVAEYDLYLIPISPKHIMVFFKPEMQSYIWQYIKDANQIQIKKANRFVYGSQKVTLEMEFNKYYKETYDFLMKVNPNLLKGTNLKRGDFIDMFPRVQIRLDDNLKKTLVKDKIILD